LGEAALDPVALEAPSSAPVALDAVPVFDDEPAAGAPPGDAGALAPGDAGALAPGAAAPPGGGAECQPVATCASLLTETLVRPPFWAMVVVYVPSSTRVIVSPPNFRTLTLGACALAVDPDGGADDDPVEDAAGADVDEPEAGVALAVPAAIRPGAGASLLTETLVWRPLWSMVVVFFPSSIWVIVSRPNFRTETLGACNPAKEDAEVLVEEAGGAGVAGAEVVVVAGEAAAEAPVVEAAAGPAVADAVVVAEVDPEEAAAEVDPEEAAVVAGAGVEPLDDRAGGGEGSAAADPGGFAAPEPPAVWPDKLCKSCGRSLSASVMWPSACRG
jgi:hypothetical protein